MKLQQEHPEDYVIGTGEAHSVRECVTRAFAHLDLDWRDHVLIDPALFRPSEVDHLLADPTKARRQLSWEPRVTFMELVKIMVEQDFQNISNHCVPGLSGGEYNI